jgi:hypothetical protein
VCTWEDGADVDVPGWTEGSLATPMTDYPIANANADALFVCASLAVLGVSSFWDAGGSSGACTAANTAAFSCAGAAALPQQPAGLVAVSVDALLALAPGSGMVVSTPVLAVHATRSTDGANVTGTYMQLAGSNSTTTTTVVIKASYRGAVACAQLQLTLGCALSFQVTV